MIDLDKSVFVLWDPAAAGSPKRREVLPDLNVRGRKRLRTSFACLENAFGLAKRAKKDWLGALPPEIVAHILNFLGAKELCMLQLCNKYLAAAANDDYLWKRLFERDIGQLPNRLAFHFSCTWQWLYRSKKAQFPSRSAIMGRSAVGTVAIDEKEGIRWEGHWRDGQLNGYGIGFAVRPGAWDEGLIVEGCWENHQLNGLGMERWTDGEYVVGNYRHNVLHGPAFHSWPDGSWYKGEYACDLEEGHGTKKYADGSMYSGQFSRGNRHGTGKMSYADGSVYEGQWRDDARWGYGRLQSRQRGDGRGVSSVVYEGEWAHDVRHGQGRLRMVSLDGSVQIREGVFCNDKLEGAGVCWVGSSLGGDAAVCSGFQASWNGNKRMVALNRSY